MESPAAFDTYTSPRFGSTEMPVGQLSWVFGPTICLTGATLPVAPASNTVIDGGPNLPVPKITSRRPELPGPPLPAGQLGRRGSPGEIALSGCGSGCTVSAASSRSVP